MIAIGAERLRGRRERVTHPDGNRFLSDAQMYGSLHLIRAILLPNRFLGTARQKERAVEPKRLRALS
jgi:hypothetical protein